MQADAMSGRPGNGRIQPGEVLRQRYHVLGQIGQGGFGAVYKAEDTELGQRLLAVKEMNQPNGSPQEVAEEVEAFKREALMLAGLKHAHLPRIYDHFHENEHWYLVMDYIEGETLEQRLSQAKDGRLALLVALRIAEQLCDVLDYLHTRQPPIVFRDLKPANVILTPDNHVYLIDFGIARHFKPGQAKDTMAFGSPGYAAPEQYGKEQTTPRADIYSLGSMLHQMLSGSDPSLAPFRFAPLTSEAPVLQRLLTRMLDMDAQQRPADVLEVKEILLQMKNQQDKVLSMPPLSALVLPSAPATLPAPVAPYTPIVVHEHHYGVVRAVGWSPDSRHTASATDAIIRVWDARSGRNLVSYRDHPGVILHMAWSPSDMRIASLSEENKLRIWDATDGKLLCIYPGSPGTGHEQARILAWSYDGYYLAVVGNAYLRIWDTNDNKIIAELKHKFFSPGALTWSPDGLRLAVSYENKVLIWQPHAGRREEIKIYRYAARVNTVAWSPDGEYLASGGYDRAVHVMHVSNGLLAGSYRGHRFPVCSLSWSPDSKRIASGEYASSIHVWDILTGQNYASYPAHDGMALAVSWSPDGKSILSGGSDRRVCIWQAP
jgi:serine/threonine protein kinase